MHFHTLSAYALSQRLLLLQLQPPRAMFAPQTLQHRHMWPEPQGPAVAALLLQPLHEAAQLLLILVVATNLKGQMRMCVWGSTCAQLLHFSLQAALFRRSCPLLLRMPAQCHSAKKKCRTIFRSKPDLCRTVKKKKSQCLKSVSWEPCSGSRCCGTPGTWYQDRTL